MTIQQTVHTVRDLRSVTEKLIAEKRQELLDLERAKEALAGGDSPGGVEVPAEVQSQEGAPRPATVADVIYELLKAAHQPLNAAEVARGVAKRSPKRKAPSYQTVYNTLKRGNGKHFKQVDDGWTLKG
jgi:hypothetical protein